MWGLHQTIAIVSGVFSKVTLQESIDFYSHFKKVVFLKNSSELENL